MSVPVTDVYYLPTIWCLLERIYDCSFFFSFHYTKPLTSKMCCAKPCRDVTRATTLPVAYRSERHGSLFMYQLENQCLFMCVYVHSGLSLTPAVDYLSP